MDVSLQIEKLIGVSSQDAASSVFSRRITFSDDNVATLVSLISVWGNSGEDAQVVLSDIFEIAGRKLDGVQSRILDSVNAVREATLDYLAAHKLDAAFAHVLFYKHAAYVVKNDDRVRIFVAKPPRISELEFESGSGPIEQDQIYLLATDKFVASFKPESFLKEEIDVLEVVDELATQISAKDDSSALAAAIIMVKDQTLGKEKEKEKAKESLITDDKIKQEEQEHEQGTGVDIEKQIEGEEKESNKEVEEGEKQEDKTLADEVSSQNQAKAVADVADSESESLEKTQDKKFGFQKPLGWALGAVLAEFKKIRRNDALAILRLRRNIVVVALVFLIILGISAGLTIKNKRDKDIDARFENHLVAANSKFSEAEALVELNKSRAREILIDADAEIAKALELRPNDGKALDIKDKISKKLSQTESLEALRFSTLVEVDGELVSLAGSGKDLVGVTRDKIYKVDAGSKSSEDFDSKAGAKSAYLFDKGAFVLSDRGVYKRDLSGNSEGSDIIDESHEAFDIAVFAGNVYLLALGQIYKYVPIADGYVGSANYLEGGDQFAQNSRFAIDGSVWVTNGSRVLSYLRGINQNFEISGLTSSNFAFSEIYTDSASDNIYVVDVANSALLVIGKDGIYKSAYQSSDFGKTRGLVVDEEGGKMYIAVGNKILQADL